MAKLVAIGDSLTQGFQSMAVCHVDRSYPAIIARCMGLDFTQFRTPDFTGSGGLPCNIEWLARRLERQVASHLVGGKWVAAVFDVVESIDEVEAYWEKGRGNEPGADQLFHNLAVWGFEVADAYNITDDEAQRRIDNNPKHAWFHPPSESRMRTARRVLNPSLDPNNATRNQIATAKEIARVEGGIENLIVWLGANNCLASVVQLEVTETGPQAPGAFSSYTLWTKEAFDEEYARLAQDIASIGAKNVFVGTVPHVTIPPVTKGIMEGGGELPAGKKYFDYYTWMFVDPNDFDPDREKHLTGREAADIDARIDQYNATIRRHATENGWHVVDTCALLDGLAVRRNQGKPTYSLPVALAGLDVQFIQFDENGRVTQGGLIALDGVHPTTCGYALVAAEFIKSMNEVGVTGSDGMPIPEPDYEAIRENDTLVSHAPTTLHDIEGTLEFLEDRFHVSRWLR